MNTETKSTYYSRFAINGKTIHNQNQEMMAVIISA